MQKSIFSQQLASIMATRVVSQDELATATGLSQSAVSRLLNSKYEPRLSDLLALSNFFKVSVNWLLGADTQETSPPPMATHVKLGHGSTQAKRRRVDVRLVNEVTLRSLVKKLRKQADDLERTCDELFQD